MHRRIRKHGIQFQLTDMSFDEYNANRTVQKQKCFISGIVNHIINSVKFSFWLSIDQFIPYCSQR